MAPFCYLGVYSFFFFFFLLSGLPPFEAHFLSDYLAVRLGILGALGGKKKTRLIVCRLQDRKLCVPS